MTNGRRTARAGLLAALLAGLVCAAPLTAASAAGGPESLQATFRPERVDAALGERFTLQAELVNPGSTATGRLIAHLNVASLTDTVYVDPEDWAHDRSVVVDNLPPGGRTSTTWELQAVNAGTFDAYLVVLPAPLGAPAGPGVPLVASPPVHLAIAERSTISAGGTLPVVLVVPALLASGALATRLRLRRR